MSPKILVIGQLPPPVHGSNVMAEHFMKALQRNGFPAQIVQKTFSRKMNEVGEISISKILRIPALCTTLFRAVREFKPDLCIYFIAVV